MSQFGAFSVFQRVTADALNAPLYNTVTKSTTNTITSNATLTNDPELSGVLLGVGTWEIEVLMFIGATASTGNFKTAWAFTGTVANQVQRSVQGPVSGNTNPPSVTGFVMNFGTTGATFTGATTYGIGSASNFTTIKEETDDFQVTASGLFSVQVAQSVSNASSTVVRLGSRLRVRQIA